MEKEEASLPVVMGRLEIEPIKYNISSINEENPFITLSQRRCAAKRDVTSSKCPCVTNVKKIHKNVHSGRKKKKILREPVLRLLQNKKESVNGCASERDILDKEINCNCDYHNNNSETLNLCTLVADCNQLKICSDGRSREAQAWCRPRPPLVSGPSCSQQVLNPPCDVTIDELASYFETLVHIPKKMSSMAEMMYI